MRVICCLAVLLLLIGCTVSEDDFTTETMAQQTVSAGEELTIELADPAQSQLHFPAGTFAEDVVVLFSDQLLGVDSDWRYFPTVDPAAVAAATEDELKILATQHDEDQVSGVVINTPAHIEFQQNIQVRFEFADGLAPPEGTQFAIYRFDFQDDPDSTTAHWSRWGSNVAVVDDTGSRADATLTTNEFRGYIGSLALFIGLTADLLENPVGYTTITGHVIDQGNAGVATDVLLYLLIGSVEYDTGFNLATTSDTDGLFTVTVPDQLIGQFVRLVFGRADAGVIEVDTFNLLDPDDSLAQPALPYLLTETQSMVIWYGDNKVISFPVRPLT